ncbi:TetR family transcriptional regulator [Brevibacterium sp. UMB10442]|nr:TetR family transcriptional regulator [Brevibacterium sp. UMB10442]
MDERQEQGAGRGRGRPSRALVTRDDIAEAALRIAGDAGFPALTMHGLARELGVTTRALYNHVRDRQEVVDLAAQRMVEGLPQTQWDASRWRESLREGYEEARAAYRRIPRAVLVSLDETVTPSEVPAARFLLAESMLTFFTDIGLSLEWALAMRGAFLSDIFAHALLIDYRYDRGSAAVREAMGQPIPAGWLEAQPDVEVPLSRGVASLPSPTSDDMFAAVVDLRIAAIERLLEVGSVGE